MFGALALAVLALASSHGAAQRPIGGVPVWSPDGAQIAWSEVVGQLENIWVARPDGSNAHVVAHRIDSLGQIAWLSDDELLYDAETELFRLPLTSGRPARLPLFTGTVDNFVVDREGKVIAWSGPPCPHGCFGPIGVLRLGRTVVRIGGDALNLYPTLSPDGRYVAFERSPGQNDHPEARGIWVASTMGGRPRQLTRTGWCPHWSPDGRWILYGVYTQDPPSYRPSYSVRLVAPDGTSDGLLLRSDEVSYPCGPTWSPDSRSVAFIDSGLRLFKIDVATHWRTALTAPAAGRVSSWLAWAPDSKSLVAMALPRASRRSCVVLSVRADGSGTRKLGDCG